MSGQKIIWQSLLEAPEIPEAPMKPKKTEDASTQTEPALLQLRRSISTQWEDPGKSNVEADSMLQVKEESEGGLWVHSAVTDNVDSSGKVEADSMLTVKEEPEGELWVHSTVTENMEYSQKVEADSMLQVKEESEGGLWVHSAVTDNMDSSGKVEADSMQMLQTEEESEGGLWVHSSMTDNVDSSGKVEAESRLQVKEESEGGLWVHSAVRDNLDYSEQDRGRQDKGRPGHSQEDQVHPIHRITSSTGQRVEQQSQLEGQRTPTMAPTRHAYEAWFKLKAISHAMQHGNRAAARIFNINESMVRKWRKQEDELRQVKETKLSFRGNKARWPQLEDRLEQWVVERRTEGRGVSTVAIRLRAAEIACDMKIDNFRGGPSWCFRFMKRRHISIRTKTTISQQLPKDYKKTLAVFRSFCKNKITEKKIQPDHVTNMDEVPLTFHIPMTRTVERTGGEKSSFTVVLGCQANGKKLPPMVIFKGKTLPKERFPSEVVVKANPKGWMSEEMMREWLRDVYMQRPGGVFHTSPSLLIYDSMRSHLSNTVKQQVQQTNSELAIVPEGLTKQLQPLDIGINRAFKVKLRAVWERWMSKGAHTVTNTGRRCPASHAVICHWIVDAWAQVSALTVVRAFTKAGIITEQPGNCNETDSDNDETDPGVLDGEIPQLFNSDTEDEDFEGFGEVE